MVKFYIFPWKMTSESAKLLTQKLGGILTRDMGEVGRNDVVINWGWGNPLGLPASALVLNRYPAIRKAIDKLETFRLLVQAGVPTLAYTESHSKAVAWSNEGNKVYGRSNEGCDGEGLMVYNPGRPPERHSFYTKGFPTHREFRINCAFGQAIDITRKRGVLGVLQILMSGLEKIGCTAETIWFNIPERWLMRLVGLLLLLALISVVWTSVLLVTDLLRYLK